MSTRSWALGFVCSLTGITALSTTACSSAIHKSTGESGAEEQPDAGETSTGGASSRGTSTRAAGGTGTGVTSLAGAGGTGTGGANTVGTVGTSSAAACTPSTGVDVPDNNGTDSNCDGVDGNVAASLFVSPTGLDSDNGTKDAPFRSIGHAISVASASKTPLDILICEGTYAENLTVNATMGMHGGYNCDTWVRTGARAVVAPTSGVALRVEAVAGPMKVSKISFQSADATTAGGSSQAVQVVNSKGISFDHSAIVAGNGANGAAGTVPANIWSSSASSGAAGAPLEYDSRDTSVGCHDANNFPDGDLDGYTDVGNDQALARCTIARAGTGTAQNNCVTPQLTLTTFFGGKGGNGGVKPNAANAIARVAGTAGSPSTILAAPNPGTPGKAFGSTSAAGYSATNNGGLGNVGQPGPAGRGGDGGFSCLLRVGELNTSDPYTITLGNRTCHADTTCDDSIVWGLAQSINSDWASYAGEKGSVLREVTMFPGAGGGGGGAPGCGGAAGLGGKGGGASIALFVSNSEVTLTWSDINSGNGGAGGDPSDGGTGQPGGQGGKGGAALVNSAIKLPAVNGTPLILEANLKGKDGTNGGQGQKGTAGGPGGGGPSVAILWDGASKPNYDATVTLKIGAGGVPGKLIEGASPGSAGVSADVMSVTDASAK